MTPRQPEVSCPARTPASIRAPDALTHLHMWDG